MKVLNWKKLPANKIVPGSVWATVSDNVGLVFPTIDFDELETNFQSLTASTPAANASSKKPKSVSIISPKRAQAVNIFLKSVRMTSNDIGALILSLDPVKFTAEFAELLAGSLPDSEELDAVQSFVQTHPMTKLEAPERYFLAIGKMRNQSPCMILTNLAQHKFQT